MVAAEKSTIILSRTSTWANRFRKFKVEIDGFVEGVIANGQSVRFHVRPGKHSIRVKYDWYKSVPFELDIAEGDMIRLECGSKTGLASELDALVAPGRYLTLKLAEEVGADPQEGIWDKLVALAGPPSDQQIIGRQEDSGQAEIHLFISYRREDSPDVCGRIYDRLIQQFGKEAVFKDVDSIPLGVDFRTYLEDVISKCAVMLAVIGDGWFDTKGPEGKSRLFDSRDYVRIEIESALKRNIPVVPLLVRNAQLPEESELPDSIKPLVFRNGLQIRPDPDFHHDMDRLIEGICEGANGA